MTSTGGYVDISTLLSYFVTVVLIGLTVVNFVKYTASKYLNPNLRFEGEENIAEIGLKEQEKGMEEEKSQVCAVCERQSTKRCSRCKSVRYCSSKCQSEHWNQGHKLDCRPATGHVEDGLKNSLNFSNVFRTSVKDQNVTLSKSSDRGVSLDPANGCSNNISVKPKKVLFSYEKFVKLFNWNKTNFPPCGLINCGNSCFVNVVLQCLTYTRPLVAYLLEGIHMQTCRRNDSCFLCELERHVRRVCQSDEPFQPLSILSHIAKMPGNLSCGRQEDAHEFMSVVVDSMQSILLDEFGGEKALHPDSRETTLIYHIFGGCLRSQVTCTQCFKVSDNYDKSLDLIIEIHGDVSSLEDALEKHTSVEWLDGDNKYNCEGCHSYVRAQKQLTIHQAPNILTITLKRYQTGRFGKLNKRVTFPETLNISPYLSEEDDNLHIYKLYAVIVHVDMLNASFFGHYICYVKDLNGSWYRIDDCKVRSVELEEVLSQRGYMLLYSRLSARPSPDVPKFTGINMEKGDLNSSSALVNSHCNFISKSDAYISSPFEVVTPLRCNLGAVQEGMHENVGLLDSLTTTDGVGSIQRPDSGKGSFNSCDTDLSVDFTSEGSGLPTSDLSSSEMSSIVSGEETLDKLLSPLPEQKLMDTCLHGTSCPHILDAKNSDKCSPPSVEGNLKQCESMDLQKERSISVCPLTGMTSLLQQNIDDDTPRTSGLTEDETSSISASHSTNVYVEGPEKMDCGNEVESFGNSSDGFSALLKESDIDEIVDCSLQQIPLNTSEILALDDKVITGPNSSFLHWPPSVMSPDKWTTPLDYKDSLRQPVGRSSVSDASWMETDKDVCHELHIQQKVGNVSQPDASNTDIQSTEQEAVLLSKDQETVPHILSHIYSSSTMDVGSHGFVGWTDILCKENGMAEGSADSISELESHEYNDTLVSNEMRQTDQITILDNNLDGAILPGSGSSFENSPTQVSCAKVKTFSSNGAPNCNPGEKTVKPKPLFAAGFLNKSPNLHPLNISNPLQENGNHSVSCSGSSSSPNGSIHCVDSSLNVTSEEKCSNPLDEAKIESPACSHFDINSETSGTGRRNNLERKPLFAPGFLNRTSKSPAVTQSNPSLVGCSVSDVAAVHKLTMGNEISGIEQFDTSNCKLMPVHSEIVDMAAEQKENVEHNQSGYSSSNEKELITANGRKRALSSESLHTDQGNSPIVITNGKSNVERQKQGRNDSCLCGSQRKWKKCCGSADALRQITGR